MSPSEQRGENTSATRARRRIGQLHEGGVNGVPHLVGACTNRRPHG